MIAFILRRSLYMIPVLAGILVITLFLFFVVAEDPVLQYAGQNPNEAQLRALRTQYDLDAPAFFSLDYLTGEDILKSKRREQVDEVFAEFKEYIAEGTPPDTLVAQYDDLREKWSRGTTLLQRSDEFNGDVRSIRAGARQVDFDNVKLDEDDLAILNDRSWLDSHFFRVARFDFSNSMQYEEPIWDLIIRKVPITLSITIPMFLIGLAIQLALSLFAARHRGRAIDTVITILAVLAMSVPFLSYIILGQWFAAETRVFPVSGWAPGLGGLKFLAFPIAIGIVAGLGSSVRFYRAVLLEEMDQDYVRTARAKGVKGVDVLFIHVLRNAGIPIVTRLSVIIPFLITGSLLIERMFEIPGLGDLMLSGITARDFWVVMPLTYLLAVVYSITVLMTDVAYAFIDPRVRVT